MTAWLSCRCLWLTGALAARRARALVQVCVVGNVLWLFGGTIELGEKEITLDDMWSLDLAKMDG